VELLSTKKTNGNASAIENASAFQDPPFELEVLSVRLFGLAEL
jgi:hypothetical protein